MVELREGYVQTYKNLFLTQSKSEEFSQKYMGGYKYTISNSYGQGVTAFRTDKGLQRYLKRTGLKKQLRVGQEDEDAIRYRLIGTYQQIFMRGDAKALDEFGKKKGMKWTKILSNGRYTKAYYKDGKIYLLNPNDSRKEFEYFWE
jgi:hypothetical protein